MNHASSSSYLFNIAHSRLLVCVKRFDQSCHACKLSHLHVPNFCLYNIIACLHESDAYGSRHAVFSRFTWLRKRKSKHVYTITVLCSISEDSYPYRHDKLLYPTGYIGYLAHVGLRQCSQWCAVQRICTTHGRTGHTDKLRSQRYFIMVEILLNRDQSMFRSFLATWSNVFIVNTNLWYFTDSVLNTSATYMWQVPNGALITKANKNEYVHF